jgi:hypothetical protein
MLIPAKHITKKAATGPSPQPTPPSKHLRGDKLEEGEYIILKGGPNDKDWYCAQILEILVDRIKVNYHTTETAPLPQHCNAPMQRRVDLLTKARFSKTWVGRHTGLPIIIALGAKQKHTILYTGKIPTAEIDQHVLIRNVSISTAGRLSADTIMMTAALRLPHHRGAGGTDDFV